MSGAFGRSGVAVMDLVVQVTWYGGPRDPFRRIRDHISYERTSDGSLVANIRREVTAHAYAKHMSTTIFFGGVPCS